MLYWHSAGAAVLGPPSYSYCGIMKWKKLNILLSPLVKCGKGLVDPDLLSFLICIEKTRRYIRGKLEPGSEKGKKLIPTSCMRRCLKSMVERFGIVGRLNLVYLVVV